MDLTAGRPHRRTAATTLDELLVGASSREPMKTSDSKSAAAFERVVVDGVTLVVKHLTDDDWLARASRDETARAVSLWEDGVYDTFADIVDSTVVGAARLGVDGAAYPAALVMRDVADALMPADGPADLRTHAAFIDAMAAMHARCWEQPPATDYMPLEASYSLLSPHQAQVEQAGADSSDVLRMVEPGWRQVHASHPELVEALRPFLTAPHRLVDAFGATPVTFLHGDWKMGNLGLGADGCVVLLDWDRPAIGPATADLAWYVAVNCERLPESKDATLDRYRQALESNGVTTSAWWDEQLPLALIGGMVQLGWSKAGQPDELDWWAEQVMPVAVTL